MFVTHQSVLCSLNRTELRDQFFEFEELWIFRVLGKQKIETEEEEETSRREDPQRCSQFQRSSFLLEALSRFPIRLLSRLIRGIVSHLDRRGSYKPVKLATRCGSTLML